jgi:undecaprenyl-diphosphatase
LNRQPAGAARWRALFLASAGIFIVLALAARFWGVFPGETQLYQWVTGWASPGIAAVFRWINELGSKWVLTPALLLLLWAVPPARKRWWLWIGVMVLAPIFEDLAKSAVRRSRPEGTAFGFPSGHVTAAAAFFPLAAYLVGKSLNARRARALWVGACCAVLLVGTARIVLRAHWPADVIGGAALGIAIASAAIWRSESKNA